MKVLAAVAHPDDIEFMLAGTLLLLQKAGCEIHMWNLCNGCLGTETLSYKEIIGIRLQEAAAAADLIGARYHEPLFDDMGIFYDTPSLARVAGVVRQIQPDIVLTHSPSDYMEDHQNTCRLIQSAAFARGMVNFKTEPESQPETKSVRIYHALPHGLMDFRGRKIAPDGFVDISTVLETKKQMLACHRSQKEWLDASQGMDSYVDDMVALCKDLGDQSKKFPYAEGLIRHNHLGYCTSDFDPLPILLKADYQPVWGMG